MGEGLLHRRASHVVDELACQSMSPSRAATPAAYSLRIAIWIASPVASAIISWWLMASPTMSHTVTRRPSMQVSFMSSFLRLAGRNGSDL
jgi:hypothetical protein